MATYDAATARLLLESAIAATQEPVLSTAQIDQLLVIGSADGTELEWTSAGLNRAASIGWQWKAAAATGEYDKLGGGPGTGLERPKLYDRCMAMAVAYAPGGGRSVDGDEDANSAPCDTYVEVIPYLTGDWCGEVVR